MIVVNKQKFCINTCFNFGGCRHPQGLKQPVICTGIIMVGKNYSPWSTTPNNAIDSGQSKPALTDFVAVRP